MDYCTRIASDIERTVIPHGTSIVPLARAVLCLNPECEAISDAPGWRCPRCGQLGLVNVQKLLGTLKQQTVSSTTR